MAEQMEQMAKKLQQMADAHEQAKRDLEREIERLEKEGDMAGAGQAAVVEQRLEVAQRLRETGRCESTGDSGVADFILEFQLESPYTSGINSFFNLGKLLF